MTVTRIFPQPQKFDLAPFTRERRLWAAVIEQAILDISEPHPAPPVHKHIRRCSPVCTRTLDMADGHHDQLSARHWFNSPAETVGSFRWICGQLNLDARAALRGIAEGVAARGGAPSWWRAAA